MHTILFCRSARSAAFVLMLVLAGCAGSAPLQESLPAEDIEIDGRESDWYEALRPVADQNISIGVVNDAEFLYVALLTSDPATIEHITSRGLVLWMDPAGGTEPSIGLQFPLGRSNVATSGPAPRTDEAREQAFELGLLEMELLRDGGDERVRIPVNAIAGVSADASLRNGTLFYEARVPLRPGGPYTFAAEVAPGGTVGIGLQSAEISEEDRRRAMLEGAANSPMQGGGSYGGYYGGAPPTRMRADDQLRVWRRVVLR
ncbi:MAG TPA: hypothetical protein VF190_13270 [Rhodothermales bacterium]